MMVDSFLDFFHFILTARTIPDGDVVLAWTFVGQMVVMGIISYGLSLLFRRNFKASPEEPKPGELQVQTSTRGNPVPVVYGKRRLSGNLIWYDNFQTHRHEETQETGGGGGGKGGGGGGGSEITTVSYTYSVSFAFGVCMGVATVLKIWRGKDEIPSPDWENLGIRIYKGTADQNPDSHISSFVSRPPAYRNVCYVVFENFDLGEQAYMPNFSFEVSTSGDVFEFERKWGSYGTDDGQFDEPIGIYVYGSEVYTVEWGNHRVQVFDLDGIFQRKWGSYGTGDGQFDNPRGICILNNEVYVVDTNNNRIQVFDLSGNFIRKWGSPGSGDGQFDDPSDIDIYGNEVYVTDYRNHRIQVFDLSGNFIRKWGSLTYPNEVTVYGDEVYVSEATNHHITVFDLNGNFQRQWGSYGTGDGQFNAPYGIGVSGDEVYVCDRHNHRVQVFDLNGNFRREWGSYGTDDGQFNQLFGICIRSSIYITEAGNHRVQVFGHSDMTPPAISKGILTNDLYGLGLSEGKLDLIAFSETEEYCKDNDMFISILIDGAISVVDFLQNILAHHNGYMTYQNGKIAHKQIKTESIENTINVDTDVIRKDPPVDIQRDAFRDIKNQIKLKYTKRVDAYTVGIVIAEDEVHQKDHGLKDGTVTLDGYTQGTRAQKFAYTILRRSLKNPMRYSFSVGPKKVEKVLPGAVFALTDSQLGVTELPMRVISIKEGKDYKVDVDAVEEIDYILDTKDAPSDESYTPPPRGGDPGNVVNPMLSEFPPLITLDDLIVSIQYSESGKEEWAGATIYQSYDDTTYTARQSSYGAGLTGVVDSVTPGKVTITITDEDITLGSLADVFALLSSLNTNMCWVKESGIYFRFAKATLVAAKQWDLEGIIWDSFGAPSLIHNISAGQTVSFLKYKRAPLPFTYPLERKGSTIYIKIVSFNFYGEHEDISLITPQQIAFEAVGSRPIAPQNLEIDGKGNITKIGAGDILLRWRSCNRLTRGLDYERSDQIQEDTDFIRFDITVKSGGSTLRSVSVTATTWTYTSAMQTEDGNPASIKFEITKLCEKNKSFKSSLDITVV